MRLELSSPLDIEALAYIRTTDGFLTGMNATAPTVLGEIWVPTFNPASNTNQVSYLRLVNYHTLDPAIVWGAKYYISHSLYPGFGPVSAVLLRIYFARNAGAYGCWLWSPWGSAWSVSPLQGGAGRGVATCKNCRSLSGRRLVLRAGPAWWIPYRKFHTRDSGQSARLVPNLKRVLGLSEALSAGNTLAPQRVSNMPSRATARGR